MQLWLWSQAAAALAQTHPGSASTAPRISGEQGAQQQLERSQLALRAGHRGLTLYEQGRYSEAAGAFEQAEHFAHSPVFVLYWARAKQQLGQLLEAQELYLRLAAEVVAKDAPASWQRAVSEGKSELAQLRANLPRARLLLLGEPQFPVTLWVNRRELRMTRRQRVIETDPGSQHVLAVDQLGRQVEMKWTASAQPNSQVSLALHFSAPKTPEPPAEPRGAQRAAARQSHRAAIVAGSLGGSFLVAGGSVGVVALSLAGKVRSRCVDDVCRPSDFDQAQRAIRLSNLATAGVAVGLVGVATGLTLWGGSARVPRASQRSVRLGLSATQASLFGTF